MPLQTRLAASVVALSLSVAAVSQTSHTPRKTAVTQAEVDKITREAILIDTHNDVTSLTVNGYDIATPNTTGQTDLPRMKQGNLGAEFFAVYVSASYVKDNASDHRALDMIDTVKTDIVGKHPEFVFATTAGDIEKAHKDGKIAALMGIEGGHAIEDDLRLLRDFYTLGIRYMTLTHFNTNHWADSQGDVDDAKVEHHNGLTPFGKDVVREMNRLGMMVDISHVADKTFFDALEVSTAPLIASHSSCRAISGHTRNMTDEMIGKLAAKGGVIQISFGCDFLSDKYYKAEAPLQAEMRAKFMDVMKMPEGAERTAAMTKLRADFASKLPPATLADVVAQIDHAVQVGGVDHVGIGTDFDGVGCVPADLDSYAKFPALTKALLEKGYSAEDIKKIYGGNLLRVMHAVEKRAAELKSEAPVETVYKGPGAPRMDAE